MSKVRLRFAPSPTGPLHIGGVRTALYNYLYAKKMGGTLILRIEDTDQTRYVEGAEEYIIEALSWCGIKFDEGPNQGGNYGPYRQSERKAMYREYAEQLVENGHAYYSFDTPAELDEMRERLNAQGVHAPKYNHETRSEMRNSLTLDQSETKQLIEKGENVVIRLKIPTDERITIHDGVRGDVSFSSNELDDKVILKGDGMPTYHLANIVDDHFMEISHVIRGEEWLSSTAHHLLMYKMFGWQAPNYAHIPLLLKPQGKGKLSKRDGAKFGFPVFPISWESEHEEDNFIGFREDGYLPEALMNFLAFLGWNPGTEQEIFSIEELKEAFTIDNIVKSGARFDVDKIKWFNQQYIMATKDSVLAEMLKPEIEAAGFKVSDSFLESFARLMKERVMQTTEFIPKARYFFQRPTEYHEKTVRKKYKPENKVAFIAISEIIKDYEGSDLAKSVKDYITENELGFGAILPILRVAITGGMEGPDLFEMITLIGKEESAERIALFLDNQG